MKSYDAFLSYARADTPVVDDLYRRLSRFRTPRALTRQHPAKDLPRSLRIFLDRKSLQIGGTIPGRLSEAIASSRFLVVVCSKAAAQSHWVNEEVGLFLRSNPAEHVLPVFLRDERGEPLVSLLPPALSALGDRLPLGADLLVDGGAESVSHKVIGAILGVPQDQVAREQERADKARRRVERLALGAIIVLSLSAALAGWGAYNQAKRAETAVLVSLDAVDSSIPFTTELLSQGRIRVSETTLVDTAIEDLLKRYDYEGLEQLPDLRFALGQVMVNAAQLSGAGGDRLSRWDRARLAIEMLQPFRDESGTGVWAFCSAALEQGRAALDVERSEVAIPSLLDCRDLAVSRPAGDETDTRIPVALTAAHLRSRLVLAQYSAANGAYSLALDDLETIRQDPALERLEALSAYDSALIQAEVGRLRGGIFLALEEFARARGAFSETERLYRSAGLEDLAIADLMVTRAWVEAESTGEFEMSMSQIAEMQSQLHAALEADPGRMGLHAAISDAAMTLADVRASRLGRLAPPQMAREIELVVADYTAAGVHLAKLVAFDPNNRGYNLKEAERLTRFADFLFRLAETYGEHAACERGCLDHAYRLFRGAHQQLEASAPLSGSGLRYRADIELRLARTVRAMDGSSSEEWLRAGRETYAQLEAMEPPPRVLRALQGRLDDEAGDLALAAGRAHEAAALFRKALEASEAAASGETNWITVRRDLAWARLRYAEALLASGDAQAGRDQLLIACQGLAASDQSSSWLMSRDRVRVRDLALREGVDCP